MWNNRRSKIVLEFSEISSQILWLMKTSKAGPTLSDSRLTIQIKELHQAGKSTQLFAHCLCYLRSTSPYHAEPSTKLKAYRGSWLLFWENISKSTCWSQNVPCKPRQPISSYNVLPQSKISIKQLQLTLLWAQEILLAQREDQKGSYPEIHEEQVKNYAVTLLFLTRSYFCSCIWQIRFKPVTFFSSVKTTFPECWLTSSLWEVLVAHW